MKTKVCIIGAGSSGLTACKAMLDQGIPFVCFEKGSAIGGNWRYNNDNGMSSAYRSLHINTNREIMSFADYPMPKHYATFPHHTEILAYFESYAHTFNLLAHIKFGIGVENVEKLHDGTFEISTSDGQKGIFSHVIVANGHHWNPRYPEPAFPGNFTGQSIHAHHYRTSEVLERKSIVILGMGNSAVDIACEAARLHTCKQVTMATRSGAYIIPNWLWSIPFDQLANPVTARLPLFVQRFLLKTSLFLARGRQQDYGVPVPKRPILSEHPTVSQDLLNMAGRGLIQFKPNIQKFDNKTIFFEDGSSQETDLLIYCTGYKITFPFLKHIFFNVEDNNNLQLYLRMIHPDIQNMFFLGFVQPLGPIMPLAEIQSKYIAQVILGNISLPTKDLMQKAISKETKKNEKRYNKSPRHTIQVDFHLYRQQIQAILNKIKQR